MKWLALAALVAWIITIPLGYKSRHSGNAAPGWSFWLLVDGAAATTLTLAGLVVWLVFLF